MEKLFNARLKQVTFRATVFIFLYVWAVEARGENLSASAEHAPTQRKVRIKESPTMPPQPDFYQLGFVYLSDIDPTIQVDLRYASHDNFMGRPLSGYKKAVGILTKEAAVALSKVQQVLKSHYGDHFSLKVYDAYRPQKAVDDIVKWVEDESDVKMKAIFYPDIPSKEFLLREQYIARKSTHTRGSTVDLTIIDTRKEAAMDPSTFQDNSIDMATIFDFFGPASHCNSDLISPEALKNRLMLRTLMEEQGFLAYRSEWWHFTLKDEPFPNRYFNFNVE